MINIFKPKFFSILQKGYKKTQLTQDALAGIIVGIVALPLAIAFAVASGVSPEKGLITAIVAGFIISFLGGSRVQIGGPTGAFVVIVFGIVEKYGFDGLMISTFIAGIMLVVFGLLRLGSLLKFIPHSLIVGFTSGIALVIFSTQIKDALGLEIVKVPSDFIDKWSLFFNKINTTNFYSLGITIVTILIAVYSKKIVKKIPGSFIAIVVITLLVSVLKLPVTTIETLFGEIPRSFSLSFPNIDISQFSNYLEPALSIAILGGIESLLSAVVADGMISGNHRSNTELIAQGVANMATPIFGGIPATGAIARTATNVKNGGRTPMAGIIHAITLLLIMFFFGSLAKLIPMSCLAGVLIVVAYNMSEWRSFVSILKGSFFDVIVLATTFILTVFVDLTIAIEVGIVLSALLFMKRMADSSNIMKGEIDSDVLENYENISKEISIYEISGPFFFASAKTYSQLIKTQGTKSKVIIIRMRHVPFIDTTGLHNLKETLKELKSMEIMVILSGVNNNVSKDLKKTGINQIIKEENICNSFENAISKAEKYL